MCKRNLLGKRVLAMGLTMGLAICSACASTPSVGKDEGNNQNAQIIANNDANADQTDSNENGNADNSGQNDNTDNTDANNDANNDANATGNTSDTNTSGTVNAESSIPAIKTSYHAYYDGKVYFRLYDYADFYDSVFLYFSDPFYLNDSVSYNRKIYAMDANGNVEVVEDHDQGSGTLFIVDGKLYSQYSFIGEDGSVHSSVYEYDLKTKKKNDWGIYTDVVDQVGDYLVCKTIPYYEGDVYVGSDYSLVNRATGQALASAPGEYLCGDDESFYTLESYTNYDNNTMKVKIFRVDAKGQTVIAEMDNSYFRDWYEKYAEAICFQMEDEDLFINVGNHAGTGHFYEQGLLLDVKKDGSGFKVVEESSPEFFYITEDANRYTINYSEYDYDEGKSFIKLIPEDGLEADYYFGQRIQKPYTLSGDMFDGVSIPYNSGDTVIYADNSGKLYTLIKNEDIEKLGFKLGVDESVDYEEASITELYNIEYVNDFVFFSIGVMDRYPTDDIGWRYAYRASYRGDFVKNLKTGEVTKLHEAE